MSVHPRFNPPRPRLSDEFRLCPRCGEAGLRIERERHLHCPDCGFLFFFNNAAAAGAFILFREQLVLCVRGKDPGRGGLDVPGGFIEFGETVEQGLRREVSEEMNLEVGPLHYLTSEPNEYLYSGVLYRTTDLFFTAEVTSLEGLKTDDEVTRAVVTLPGEVDPARFAFESTRRAFLTWVSRRGPTPPER